jgi:hypothetical protein
MTLSVIIATRNRARSLARALGSLAEARPPKGGWEVIVVDNACRDATAAVCAASPNACRSAVGALTYGYRGVPGARFLRFVCRVWG